MRAPTPSAAAELAVPDRKELLMRIDSYNERVHSALILRIERSRERLDALIQRTAPHRMQELMQLKRDEVRACSDKANSSMGLLLDKYREALAREVAKVNAMNPLSVLSRGYSVAENENGVVKSVDDLRVGDKVRLIFADGSAYAGVTGLNKGDVVNE